MKTKKNKKAIQTNVLGGGNFSCRHPKLYKWLISNFKAFWIGGLISFVVTASATVVLHSRQVRYKNDKSVEQAINELYEKAKNLKSYSLDDEINVNNERYYVLYDSPSGQDYVIALKAEPLTTDEVNEYKETGSIRNENGYGGISYYYRSDCSDSDESGCISDYASSDVKKVVTNWSNAKFSNNQLKEIDGYKARLININDLTDIWQYSKTCTQWECYYSSGQTLPEWLYSGNWQYYYSMDNSDFNNSTKLIYSIGIDGQVKTTYNFFGSRGFSTYGYVYDVHGLVRPVINVYKSAITRVKNN